MFAGSLQSPLLKKGNVAPPMREGKGSPGKQEQVAALPEATCQTDDFFA